MKSQTKILVVALIFAAFLAADLFLAFGHAGKNVSNWEAHFTYLICFSQISLLALWAASSGMRYYSVYLILLLGVVFLWYIEMKSFDFNPFYPPAITLAVTLILQALVFVLIASFIKAMQWTIRLYRGDIATQNNDCFQFGIDFLLMWIFNAALTLGLLRWAVVEYYWSFDGLVNALGSYEGVELQYIKFHTVLAFLVYWAVSARGKCLQRIAVALIGVQTLALFYNQIFSQGTLWELQWVSLDANLYSGILLAGLLPMRYCGLLGKRGKENCG